MPGIGQILVSTHLSSEDRSSAPHLWHQPSSPIKLGTIHTVLGVDRFCAGTGEREGEGEDTQERLP